MHNYTPLTNLATWMPAIVARSVIASRNSDPPVKSDQSLVTTASSHSHVGSQAFGEVRHRLVNVFLRQLFPDSLYGDFHLLNRLRLWLPMMPMLRASAVTLSISKSASTSHSQQTGSFQSHHHTTEEDNVRNVEKSWGLSWLKQHNFFTFRHISTKLGDKVHILLLNSYVQFHMKIMYALRTAEISTKAARVTFILTL